ncbi:transcriptional regulator LeuO [Vibrio inusitatus NBRC 102082]|uniref:Transcriptional regulator LeuO n=1 Tax=Vibrio inusitatus NBRC 102082 TaxID=1219070 RepID=A0A4Y3HS31_9VIBR|nr:transcriptional regulator LeuO [Vibrio inusitatus]GEA49582.1 transcriptional regulator LeuO [Vibrio inusitatus NBRC 102082]
MQATLTPTFTSTNPDTISLLRKVDLNLIVVFEAVMAERNVTRAARILNMSQPAVSNALSRLRALFDDELFERMGRGIVPTVRAEQLQSSLSHVMHIIRDELPNSRFEAESSCRNYHIVLRAPQDQRYLSELITQVSENAPGVSLSLISETHPTHAPLNQNTDFVIDMEPVMTEGFTSSLLLSDELVVVFAEDHPRLNQYLNLTFDCLQVEKMAVTANMQSRLQKINALSKKPTYLSSSLDEVMTIVANTDLISVAPRRVVEQLGSQFNIRVLPLPGKDDRFNTYLNWHQANEKDDSHAWMKQQIQSVFEHAFPFVVK